MICKQAEEVFHMNRHIPGRLLDKLEDLFIFHWDVSINSTKRQSISNLCQSQKYGFWCNTFWILYLSNNKSSVFFLSLLFPAHTLMLCSTNSSALAVQMRTEQLIIQLSYFQTCKISSVNQMVAGHFDALSIFYGRDRDDTDIKATNSTGGLYSAV